MVRTVPPAIVIMAHDRPGELARLLASVSRADIAADTRLVFSVDRGGSRSADVASIAADFSWPHGPVSTVEHDRIGLVEHFHRCGDLALDHGSIVLLEDDLIVGPGFHRWACAALDHAADDARIAGISLSAPFFDGYRHLPFEPIADGFDAVFAQIPWYDGMAWTSPMWQSYRAYRARRDSDPATPIHRSLTTLDSDEWFPDAVRHLVASGRYYLLPRQAHATNSGAAGTHFETPTNWFQTPLCVRAAQTWRLAALDESLSVYDDHLEPTPAIVRRLVPDLSESDFTVDLLGVRDLTDVSTPLVLTTRPLDDPAGRGTPIRSWGSSLHPLVVNLIHDVEGDDIRLAPTESVRTDSAADRHSLDTLTRHALRDRLPSGRESLRRLGTIARERLRAR